MTVLSSENRCYPCEICRAGIYDEMWGAGQEISFANHIYSLAGLTLLTMSRLFCSIQPNL